MQPIVCETFFCLYFKKTTASVNNGFTLSSRKIVHTPKWTHPAIIPHIPTNKPSRAEVTSEVAEAILSTTAMDAKDLFTVLHRFCKCLSETIVWYHYLSSSYDSKYIYMKILFSYWNMFIFYHELQQDTRKNHVTSCAKCMMGKYVFC